MLLGRLGGGCFAHPDFPINYSNWNLCSEHKIPHMIIYTVLIFSPQISSGRGPNLSFEVILCPMLIIKSAVLTKLIQHPPSGAVNLEEESCVFIKHFSCESPLRSCLDANNTACLQQGALRRGLWQSRQGLCTAAHILHLTPAAGGRSVGGSDRAGKAHAQPCTFCTSSLQQEPHEWAPLSPLPPRKGNWGRERERFSNLAKVNIYIYIQRGRTQSQGCLSLEGTLQHFTEMQDQGNCLPRIKVSTENIDRPYFCETPPLQKKSLLNGSAFKKEKGWGWKNGSVVLSMYRSC